MNFRELEAVKMALAEDVGLGDVTTLATVDSETVGTGRLWLKESGVVAGLGVAERVFQEVDGGIEFDPRVSDGDSLAVGTTVAFVRGRLGDSDAERTAANFLQRLSGIATRTRTFVSLLEGTGVAVIDTRKTTPACGPSRRCGPGRWGQNHRWGLDSGVLIKDNHIVAAGGVGAALRSAASTLPTPEAGN